jgi:serine/threonine-protein kinase
VPDKLTDTGTLVGTPHYMSPEQASGERDLDGKTDVWAIGIMAFECLTGQMPVVAQNYGQLLMQLVQGKLTKLVSVRGDLPADFLAAVDAALAMRASRSDIGTFAAALVMRADPSIDAPPASAPPSDPVAHTLDMRTASRVPATPRSFAAPARPASRSRGPLVAGFFLLAAIGAGGLVASTRLRPAPEPVTSASSVSAPPPVIVSADVPAVASSSPPAPTASASAPAPPPIKRPAAKPTGRAPQPPSSATGGRLQGGVGGDVPF